MGLKVDSLNMMSASAVSVVLFSSLFLQIHGNEEVEAYLSSMKTKLRKDLFNSYDKIIIPGSVRVQLGLAINDLEMNEEKSELIVHGLLSMVWSDVRLTWKEDNYGGVTSLNIPASQIWTPDIVLYNNRDSLRANPYNEELFTIVESTGDIHWVPRTTCYAICTYDLRLWPFDEQNCTLEFGSWSTSELLIDLELSNPDGVDLSSFEREGKQFKVTDTSVRKEVKKYDCCEESYPDIRFSILLKRHSYFHSAIVFIPAIGLLALILLSFLYHPTSINRLLLNILNVIICIVYLMYLGTILPLAGKNVPYIIQLFRDSLGMVLLSIVLTVIYRNIQGMKSVPMPGVVRTVFNSWAGTVLCLRNKTGDKMFSSMSDSVSEQTIESEFLEEQPPCEILQTNHQRVDDRTADWIVTIVDRIILILYIFVFTIFLISFV